jgi:hypothetical protein
MAHCNISSNPNRHGRLAAYVWSPCAYPIVVLIMISLHCGHELSYVPRFAALWRPVVHIRTVHSISCMQGLRKCTVLTAASSWLSIPTASVKQVSWRQWRSPGRKGSDQKAKKR